MFLTILDVLGGIFINLGILLLNLKYSKDPKKKIKANIFVIIGCSSLALLFAISTTYYFSIGVQIGVIISSIYGIYLSIKEIKEKEVKEQTYEDYLDIARECAISEEEWVANRKKEAPKQSVSPNLDIGSPPTKDREPQNTDLKGAEPSDSEIEYIYNDDIYGDVIKLKYVRENYVKKAELPNLEALELFWKHKEDYVKRSEIGLEKQKLIEELEAISTVSHLESYEKGVKKTDEKIAQQLRELENCCENTKKGALDLINEGEEPFKILHWNIIKLFIENELNGGGDING